MGKEAESFERQVKDLMSHLTAYKTGELGQESLLTLIEVVVVKMKLVSDRTIDAIFACPEAALLEGNNES